MKVRFLGAHNTESLSTRMVSLLVDGKIALDAGGLTSALSIEEQLGLEAVLLTHGHYDHIRDIPTLGMNLFLNKCQTVLYGHPSVKEILATRWLDGIVYTAFFQRPADKPVFRFETIDNGQVLKIHGFKVTAVAVPHPLPAIGYSLTSPEGKTLFFSGDTGPDIARSLARVAPDVLVIEVTAPNRLQESVRPSGHLTPDLLRQELTEFRNVSGYVPTVYCVHMNASLEKEISVELTALSRDGLDVRLASEGLEINL